MLPRSIYSDTSHHNDEYSTYDSEYEPVEVFEAGEDGLSDAETNPTDPEDRDMDGHKGEEVVDLEDPDMDGDMKCDDIDVEDVMQLFEGNLHPADYYRMAIEQFNEADYESKAYAPGTIGLIDACKEKWDEYCGDILQRDPQACFESMKKEPRSSLAILYFYFDWRLNQKLGKNGKRLPGVKKSSTLETYWKYFSRLFERQIGEKLDPTVGRGMHNVLRALSKRHGLSHQRRLNRRMTVESLENHIEETISTEKKSFKLGELRLLAVLFLLLMAPAGARPTSVLRMRFGDISLVLERDPEGGSPNILIRFTLEFTKTYLGLKEAVIYPVPETMLGGSLLLSPQIFFLGILFRHRAFEAPDLTSPEALAKLKIYPEENELPLPLKDNMQETLIFRQAVKTVIGIEISKNTPITYPMIAAWFRRIGEISGLEHPPIFYSLRYNAGNEGDQSHDVSEALRNLALGHKNSRPFQQHYLCREIGADLWAVVRGKPQQRALLRQAGDVAHSRSKRRPIELTPDQKAMILTDPKIRRLVRDRDRNRRGSAEYETANKLLRNEKDQMKRDLLKKTRKEWTAKQAVEDIQRQLRGEGFATQPIEDTPRSCQRPTQRRLIEALKVPPWETKEEYIALRTTAIWAIMNYCSVEEGATARRYRVPSVKSIQYATGVEPVGDTLKETALDSVMMKDPKQRPLRCFMCVGKALGCDSDDPLFAELTKEFSTPTDVNRHFRERHLQNLQPDQPLQCPACFELLEHRQEVLTHAQTVHGILLRKYEGRQKTTKGSYCYENDHRLKKYDAKTSPPLSWHSRAPKRPLHELDESSHRTDKRQRLTDDQSNKGQSVSHGTENDAKYSPRIVTAPKRRHKAAPEDRNERLDKRQKRSPDSARKSTPLRHVELEQTPDVPRQKSSPRYKARRGPKDDRYADADDYIEEANDSDSDGAESVIRHPPSFNISDEFSEGISDTATSASAGHRLKGERRTRTAFTDEKDKFLVQLKEVPKRRWGEIHQLFSDRYPGHSKNTLQVRYSKLKVRAL